MREDMNIITQIYRRSKNNQYITKQQVYDAINDVIRIYANQENSEDFEMISPLHIEVLMDDRKAVEELIKKGKNPNYRDFYSKKFPLEIAICLDNYTMACTLIENGADVNKYRYGDDSYNPLLLAARHKKCDLIKLLILNGADINTTDAYGFNALHYILNNGSIYMPFMVGNFSVFPECVYPKYNSDKILDVIDFLIKNGINVNQTGKITVDHKAERKLVDISPLAIALETADSKIIEKLIQSGADKEVVEITPHNVYGYQSSIDFIDDIKDLDFSLWPLGIKEYKQFLKYKRNIKKYGITVYSPTVDDGYKRPKFIKKLEKQ